MALAPLGSQMRPYKDYLTPALHQRFTHASGYTLFLCYLIAAWQGEIKNLYWMFTPFGYTGLRTLMLFIPALTIYVLRVAQWHVGTRHTVNPAATVYKYFFRWATFVTPAFYIFSSWIFVEAYLWSRAPGNKLGATELGREYERIKLNERPIYLQWAFLVLALAQAGVHLWKDYDKIDIPALKPETAAAATLTKRSPRPHMVLFRTFPSTAAKAVSLSGLSWIAASISYFLLVRRALWTVWYPIARNLWSLAKTSKPTGLSPYAPLVIQIITEGSLLVLMWEVVNKAFDLYIAQEPLKNDKPITDDSKDPNGTLLNGLKSKKDAVKAIAFWELALITSSFPTRRSTIYSEHERKKGETYQQITSICLSEIKLLIERLSIATNPDYIPPPPPKTPSTDPPITLVPQISQPLRADKIVTAAAPGPNSSWAQVRTAGTGIVKSYSSPTNSRDALARDALHKGLSKAKEGKQQAETIFASAYNLLVASPLGSFFQRPLHRTMSIVVLGAPYSRASMLCNAITALTNLTTYSIPEDKMGRYQTCVAGIIRIFTQALLLLEEYVSSVGVHWSDTDSLGKSDEERRRVRDVEEVRDCLKVGLERIVESFEPYFGSLGLSGLEIGEARKAVGRREVVEMVEAAR